MDVISLLWQLGILSAVLIFGIKLGLATGLANMSKRYLAMVSIGYGGGVLILTEISSFYTAQITDLIYTYNFEFFLIMAVIMILAGIFTIREYKVFERNTTAATCMAIVAPCPCCFGSILVSILLVAPTVGLGLMNLSVIVASALVLTIVLTYFASNYLVRFINKPYPIVLGNFMFFLGIYFLLSALFLPNITAMIQNPMDAITIASVDYVSIAIIVILAIMAIGGIISKRNTNFR
jgi:predicted transporter